jgi:hypothetical protein
MDDFTPSPSRPGATQPGVRGQCARGSLGAVLTVLAMLAAAVPARADHPPVAARAGLDLALAAAQSWAPDAYLTYIENDEDLTDTGDSPRWGYLFHSPSLDKSRAYSVRDGKILVAENLDMKFEAPALAMDWIDSARAIEAAERGPARNYRTRHQGRLTTMLLMRGAFQDGDPDETTWTLIYTSPGAPALFVVVDASGAKVRRTWRG